MMQQVINNLIAGKLIRIIRWPVIHFFKDLFLRGISHKDMEVGRFTRRDGVIAELDEFRCFRLGIFTFKEVAHTFFTRYIVKDLMPSVVIMALGNFAIFMEFHDAIFYFYF